MKRPTFVLAEVVVGVAEVGLEGGLGVVGHTHHVVGAPHTAHLVGVRLKTGEEGTMYHQSSISSYPNYIKCFKINNPFIFNLKFIDQFAQI